MTVLKRVSMLLMTLLLLAMPFTGMAHAEALDAIDEDDTQVYTLVDEKGEVLMRRAGRIYVDDEYISGDNMLYRVISVDDTNHVAYAELVGEEPFDDILSANLAAFAALADEKEQEGAQDGSVSNKKLVCMYSTHSDESYEEGDGTSSKMENAGIYDVGEALKENLEKLGVEVEYSKETHHPHDAGAYRRSRRTAEELLKEAPAALIDIYRDGIPDPDEYTETVDGEDITKVRLLVGRSNPSASANRSFSKQIKKQADEQYPGLIRDIFVGKGNYNQELYPKSILLEFGTHTSDKEQVIASTGYMAEVLDNVLFGGTAKAGAAEETAEGVKEENTSGAVGIAWLIGIAVLAAAVYALASTGTLRNMAAKLGRGASEITGGMIGKRPDDEDK